LPSGIIFSNQKKSNLGFLLEGLAIEDIGVCILWPFGPFYGYLVYFVAIYYIWWSFGTFFTVWVCRIKKIWQP
jgi:hypothetical protein